MFTAFIIVTVFTAAANTYAAIVDFRRPQWVLNNMTKWGGSHSWLFTLGTLKAAGALGLLLGIGVPLIGVAAAVGLVLFFVGAIAVVIGAHWYSRLPWPTTYLLLAIGSLDAAQSVMKDFLEMSKRVDAKRHQCEGAKFCSPITNKNEMKRGKAK